MTIKIKKVHNRRIQKENLSRVQSDPVQGDIWESCNWCGKGVPRKARKLDRKTNTLVGTCPHCKGTLRPMDA